MLFHRFPDFVLLIPRNMPRASSTGYPLRPRIIHSTLGEIPPLNGDKVLLWFPQIKASNSKSLTKKWSGPFVITSVIGNLSYRIQYGTRSPIVVNAKRLKAYHPPTKWNWVIPHTQSFAHTG
eukprot:gene14511-30887_t